MCSQLFSCWLKSILLCGNMFVWNHLVPCCRSHSHKTTDTLSANCAWWIIISAIFTDGTAFPSWSSFIELIAPWCLRHHIPPHMWVGSAEQDNGWVVEMGRAPNFFAFYCPAPVLTAWLVREVLWVLQISKCPCHTNTHLARVIDEGPLCLQRFKFHREEMTLKDKQSVIHKKKELRV